MPEPAAWWKRRPVTAETLIFWAFMGAFAGMPTGTSPPTACGLAAVGIWLLSGKVLREIPGLARRKWVRPVLLLVLLPWIGLVYSPDPGGLGLDYAGKTYYWLFCFALAGCCPQTGRRRWLINAFLLGLAVNAVFGALQLIGVLAPIETVYSGLGRGYSTLAAYLVVGILILSFDYRQAVHIKWRMGLALLMAFYFFHLVILQGRTGYLTFLVLSPLIVRNLFHRARGWKIAVVCLLLAGSMFLSPVVRQRVSDSIATLRYHLSVRPDKAWGRVYSPHQDRFFMWHSAVRIFREHPLLGVGTGGYQTRVHQLSPPGTPLFAHPHNDFLYMAASYGLVGVLAFVWFFAGLIRAAWRCRDTAVGYFVFSVALVVLVSGLFNAQMLDAGMAFLLAVATGMQAWLRAEEPSPALGHTRRQQA